MKKNFAGVFLFVKTLFGGQPSKDIRKPHLAIKKQQLNIKKIWNNETQIDFGVERCLRLFLATSQFLFPGIYIRHLAGKSGLLSRKISVEVYVFLKLILPIVILYYLLSHNVVFVIIEVYLCIDTLVYILSLIFLSDIFTAPISFKRSFINIFFNFIEVCFEYAVIYSYYSFINRAFFSRQLQGRIDAIYFSFITASTVGYGDVVPFDWFCKIIVISQILVSLLFLTLFFSSFTSRINDAAYNKKYKNNVS
jgi:hypothetical protein